MDESVPTEAVSQSSISLLLRMRRRRVRLRDWLVCGPIVLALAALTYLRATSPPPSISLTQYNRVELAASEREVEQIVAARPGAYGTFWGPGVVLQTTWTEPTRWVYWNDTHSILGIGFDAEGRVCSKQLEYHPNAAVEDPKSWAWWKRLVNRSVPGRAPSAIYSPF